MVEVAVREECAMSGPDEGRTEVEELDQQIADVSREAEQISATLADAGAMDSEERAAALTNREELEGVLDGLRRRRESLRGSTG
jgi:phage host-nuclease inhibitor protein Gam